MENEFLLGGTPVLCMVTRVPMTVSHQHLRGCAGASFTKAVALRRAQMSPVVINWSKQTGPGLQA